VDIAKVRDAAVLKTGEGIRSTASGRRVMRVRMGVELGVSVFWFFGVRERIGCGCYSCVD
jgi:hypothetical protein